MRQKLQSLAIIWKLGKARRIEMKKGNSEALKYLRSLSYEGPYSGLLMVYVAHLLLVTRSAESAAYIEEALRHIEGRRGQIEYTEYCSSYLRYLGLVAADESFSKAGKETLSKPASQFVRRILYVVT